MESLTNLRDPGKVSNKVQNKPYKGEAGHISGKSDDVIVAWKRGNSRGAKGVTIMANASEQTCEGPRTAKHTYDRLEAITRHSGTHRNAKFRSVAYLLNAGFLKQCYLELNKSAASGVDNVVWKEYGKNLDENVEKLVWRMKNNKYRAQPSKRVYIPKGDGKVRPLGLPVLEDKIVQMGLKKILEAIYEPLFTDFSYGFRPGLNCHDAIGKIWKIIMNKPIACVVDADIKQFFDTVNHEKMIKALELKIEDFGLIRLIGKFLHVGIMEEGKRLESDRGTPQGGVLSPILANIYLHYVLDKWFQQKVAPNCTGQAEMVRYADDFVVMFSNTKSAEEFKEKLKLRLNECGLELADEKTRIVEFGKMPYFRATKEGRKTGTFDFVGFTHYCSKDRKGRFLVKRKTSRKKFRQKVKNMKEWFEKQEWGTKAFLKTGVKVLNLKLRGHYRYYGINGNSEMLNKFLRVCERIMFRWLNRRSQRKSYNWEEFRKLLKFNPIEQPRIYHSEI